MPLRQRTLRFRIAVLPFLGMALALAVALLLTLAPSPAPADRQEIAV